MWNVPSPFPSATVTNELLPKLKALEAKWPLGYAIQVAGAVEESSKGQGSIGAGLPVALFIVFTLLYGLLLRSLPVKDAASLVRIGVAGPTGDPSRASSLPLTDGPQNG